MDYHSKTATEVISALGSSKSGLSPNIAQKRLAENGRNELSEEKHDGILRKLVRQLTDFSIIILLAAAGLSFIVSRMAGENDITDTVVILAIILINSVIGVFEESKAEKAMTALKKLGAPEATVIRSGKEIRIPASQVVCGDILLLSAGDMVTADARLLTAVELRADESALTGESVSVEKNSSLLLPALCQPSDMLNCVFSSTLITHGHGTAIVTATGMNTQIGKIAGILGEAQTPQTPLQIRLNKLGKLLGTAALGICAVIFLLGLFRRASAIDSFMTAVSLAVAAIPEGLPAIVTVVLSMGIGKLSKKGAIVRRLPAIEALGSATVICSDKTGTLTQNKMTVTELYMPGKGRLFPDSPFAKELLRYAALCCNCSIQSKHGKTVAHGEPTETAIVNAFFQRYKNDGITKSEKVSELPFDSERKMMTVMHKNAEGLMQITKGAPEAILTKCSFISTNGGKAVMSDNRRISAMHEAESLAIDGLRVIAVAIKKPEAASKISESDLCFLGLIAMEDAPRPEAAEAVKKCLGAGITPVMITGDHALTAKAIAVRLNITNTNGEVITGSQLNTMSDAELTRAAGYCRVFARVTPEHKVRILKAFKSRGEIVAMTGDGINDAPALKYADIGCAMGKSGTQVAKNAADIILTDDNFATIVNAVEIGRGLYDNIKISVRFLISSNIGEIVLVFAASLLGFPPPLLPVQLLWLNLVTDSLPAMALGAQKTAPDIMKRRPINKAEGIISRITAIDIAAEGFLFGALSLLAFCVGNAMFSVATGRTMAFCTLSFSELLHAWNVKSDKSVFAVPPKGSGKLILSIAICVLLQISAAVIPEMQRIFGTVELTTNQWLLTAALSILPVVVTELEKLSDRRKMIKQ